MARKLVTAGIVVVLAVFAGCQSTDTGRGQRLPARTGALGEPAPSNLIATAAEADVVEQVTVHRQGYREALEKLVQYYRTVGNNRNLRWAQRELDALKTMPQYRYLIEAEVPRADLKASVFVPEAKQLYDEAVEIQRQAEPVPLVPKDEELLRRALDKYIELIRKFPTSDRIGDAAFRAATIYEHFKDYTIALSYYQRAYQWDPATPYPARFRAAVLLDRRLHRRAEALALYQDAVVKESRHTEWKDYADQRIKELSTSKPE